EEDMRAGFGTAAEACDAPVFVACRSPRRARRLQILHDSEARELMLVAGRKRREAVPLDGETIACGLVEDRKHGPDLLEQALLQIGGDLRLRSGRHQLDDRLGVF